ncbi:MAG: ACR3 family arsenite efflux transporter [Salibacter sp.]|uniref:ACR3 family arsenite efflux transporter n=1 Tax=Salibacter sp. TaxID=2010995 RepID=UPI00286FFC00|nr:ACR3 family arsenite efflux transporter [Salibacter sp.]MDR9398197.1 ACR3 family arsenite efflux transporter [Salibacter sp.]
MSKEKGGIGFFEKYLTVWVLICIVVGVAVGSIFQEKMAVISSWEIAHVNIPVAILVWMMIFPMMVQIDFSSLKKPGRSIKGLSLTVIVNWLIKPFTMAFFAWLFFDNLFNAFITPQQADEYIAGAIILGAAPCTAMVFVWSYLSGGDPNYTLVQVSINDLILLVAFIPIVQFLLGITEFQIPFDVLTTSVIVFVVIPLVAGYLTNKYLIRRKGRKWFNEKFLPTLKPVSIIAVLSTLLLLFSFQGETILNKPAHILLIAIPLTIQTYFIFFLTWFTGKFWKLPYRICAPASMIGSSNFFELAVAVAIAIFGLNSGAALTTVVGVLIEVPIMLSLVQIAKRWKYE